MAEGEGTSFENPTFEPDPWDDDDYGDETTPFFPNGASTPAFSQYQEKIEMKTRQHEKDGLPDTSYVETSFCAETSGALAWAAVKDLFPKMSLSELEVSYNTKGRLQVKMFGAGKRYYNLTTAEKGTGQVQINKSLPKEIKKALGESKYEIEREKWGEKRENFKKQMDEITQEMEKENQKLKALEESDDPAQSEIEKSRDKIRVSQMEKESLKALYNLAGLKNSDASQQEIQKSQSEVRDSEAAFIKERGDYNKSYPSERYKSKFKEVFEEVPDDEEPEIFDERQGIKSIIKQNDALRSRIVTDMYISETQEKAPEIREAAKKKTGKNQATYEKNEKEKMELLERLGIKNSVLEQEREVLQKERADRDVLIESNKKIITDLNSIAYEREEAEERIAQHERERGLISERLDQAERHLGLEDRRSLREKIKDIFKKNGVTVTAIFLAARATIGAVIGDITKALKKLGKGFAMVLNRLKTRLLLACPVLSGRSPAFFSKLLRVSSAFLQNIAGS